jgi:hypothetical protein
LTVIDLPLRERATRIPDFNVHTVEQLHAFRTVALMMAKRLAPEDLHSIASRTGIDLQNQRWLDDRHPF